MNNIIHTIRHTARAAAVLLLALLAVQTAGAQENVSNAYGLEKAFYAPDVSVVNVTADITGVGNLSLDRDLTINLNGHTISGDGLHIEVLDGSLTINGGGQDGSVGNIISGNAYDNAINREGTVTLSHVNITTNDDFAIQGEGTLNIGNNVSFNGWTYMPFDTQNVNNTGNYNYDPEEPFANVVATVTVGGVIHYFENLGAALAYIVSHPDNVEAFNIADDFSQSGDTYTIHTAEGWDYFCDLQEAGETFSGKTVYLADDIEVSRMAGSGAGGNLTASDRPFCGTFDGGGNKLTFKYGSADSPADENNIAPFRYVNNATIQHLHVDGDIYTQHVHAGGIVGMAYGTTNITDCRSSVNIVSSINGDGTHGGIMSCSWTGSTTNITGCVFDGSIQSASGYATDQCGGFVGWRNATINVKNCLLTADLSTIGAATGQQYPSATFVRNGEANRVTNSYYVTALGTVQGKQRHSITADENVTVAHAGVATHYTTSGITAYKATGASADSDPFIAGLLYNNNVVDVLYAGSGDEVSLTLSNTATGAPDGYQYDGYTASAGTLSGSTLTMPAADVTVSLALRSTGETVEVSYLDAGGNTLTHDAIALDGTESNLGNEEQETWYFVGLPTVAFDHSLNLNGDVHLILADGCTMNVTSNTNGIDVDGSLTIYGQTDGTGTLNATALYDGIHSESGNITISGGTFIANSDNGDGISTDSGTITISGGTVTATGGNGITTNSGDITISGGRVTATGDNEGILSESGNITISGGRVTVTGENAAGIYTDSGTITLGCTNASDFIYASKYFVSLEGTLKIADGQTLFDEDGTPYSGKLNNYVILNGKTLQPSVIALAAREAPDGNYWTTYYNSALGFTIDADENACAYTATYDAGQLTLHNLGKQIPKGTAVIIVADNDVVSMAATTDLPAYSGPTNNLRGVDVDTPVANITSDLGEGTLYVLGMTTVGDEQHFGFHRYTGTDMAAHKAFVHVASSPSQSARSLTMVFDDATAIQGLTPAAAPKPQAADHWYTLDGRRLQAKPTAPGIYVNNGNKVVIK